MTQKVTARRPLIRRLRNNLLLLALGWSGAVVCSLLWNIHLHNKEAHELALFVARIHLENEDLPMMVVKMAETRHMVILIWGYVLWWLCGILGIGFIYVAMHKRITEQDRTEADLKHVQARLEQTLEEMAAMRLYLRNVIDSMPSVLIGVDSSGMVTQWNREAEKITGLAADAVKGRLLSELCPGFSPWMDRVRTAVREKAPLRAEKIASPLHQGFCYADIIIYPLSAMEIEGAVIRVDDVTERVRLEDRMIQSEKMITVAGLVEGMAHELNNPLGGIVQGAQSVLRRLSIDIPKNYEVAESCGTDLVKIREYIRQREIFKFLEGIRSSGHQAASIIQYMLQFSCGAELATEARDLAEIIKHSIKLVVENQAMKSLINFSRIEFITNFDPHLPKVQCSVARIETVLLNLLKNAAQFLNKHCEEGGAALRPRITIRTVKEATMARVEVEDNGPGMNEQTRRRVFEPFFTTKEPGEGTGLGLTVSYFIITVAHQGTMSVESAPGSGAKFIFRLPLP